MRYTGVSRSRFLKDMIAKKRSRPPSPELLDGKPTGVQKPLRGKRKLTEEANKHLNPYTKLTIEQIVQLVLCDYNKKHGTDLEYVRLSRMKVFVGPGYIPNFVFMTKVWVHVNFWARRLSKPRGKQLLLFAEAYRLLEDVSNPMSHTFPLTTLSPVKRTDHNYGCVQCMPNIKHPPYGYRAGFDPSMSSEVKLLSLGDADKLSKFALGEYNKQNGTNMAFVSAQKCVRFSCAGLLMDLNEKNTSWVHMNFEARRPKFRCLNEEVILLFAELYEGDNDQHVLASLSIVKPTDKLKTKRECAYCPADILHPLCGFRCVSTENGPL